MTLFLREYAPQGRAWEGSGTGNVPSGASRARGREVRHRPDATPASSTVTRVMRRTGQHEDDRDADASGRLGQEPPWSATTRTAARSRYYFEPTSEAVAEASRGKVLIGIACLLLTAAAGYTSLVAGRPLWVAGGLLAPVVLCGGLTMVASETFFLSSQSSSRIPQHWPRVWRALSSESEGGRSDARCQSKVADQPDAGECRRTRILAAAHGATCVTSPPAVLRPRRDLLRSRLRRRRARRQGVLRPRRLT